MNIKNHVLKLIFVTYLVFASINVRAENWVGVDGQIDAYTYFFYVDSDSVRKGSDGLIYFNKKESFVDGWSYSSSAIDCKKHIYYVVEHKSEWRSKGVKIKPDTEYSIEEEYFCS